MAYSVYLTDRRGRFATTPIGEVEQQACSCDLTAYATLRLSSHWSRNLPNTRNEQAQTGLERFCSASPIGGLQGSDKE